MTGDGALLLLIVAATPLLSRIAYRRGCRRAAPRPPADVVAELRAHKITCLREPPERVALELSLLLGATECGAPQRNERHRETARRRERADAPV